METIKFKIELGPSNRNSYQVQGVLKFYTERIVFDEVQKTNKITSRPVSVPYARNIVENFKHGKLTEKQIKHIASYLHERKSSISEMNQLQADEIVILGKGNVIRFDSLHK